MSGLCQRPRPLLFSYENRKSDRKAKREMQRKGEGNILCIAVSLATEEPSDGHYLCRTRSLFSLTLKLWSLGLCVALQVTTSRAGSSLS